MYSVKVFIKHALDLFCHATWFLVMPPVPLLAARCSGQNVQDHIRCRFSDGGYRKSSQPCQHGWLGAAYGPRKASDDPVYHSAGSYGESTQGFSPARAALQSPAIRQQVYFCLGGINLPLAMS